MLLRGYSLRLLKPKCNLFTETIHAQALLRNDVMEVLPYLNAVVDGCKYAPNAPALTMEWEGRSVVIWPREIAFACEDEADARRVLDGVCRLIKEVWERREGVEPNHEEYGELTAMEVYRLLPRTNCRQCGETACLAFAVKVASRQALLEACEPLFGEEHGESAKELVAALRGKGYAVPEGLG